jgi:pyocin large subunit-like protein
MIGRPGGLPWRRLLTAALALVAVILFGIKLGERSDAREGAPQSSVARVEIGFADARRLDEHYAKHGGEFGSISRQEYLRLAQALRDAPVGGPVLEAVRRDGVTTRFDRGSGAFIAFNANGIIRTFFKPNDGERYFRRQAERGAE